MINKLFAEMLEEDAEFRELMKEKVKECVKTEEFKNAMTGLIANEVKNLEIGGTIFKLINDAVKNMSTKTLITLLMEGKNNG